MCSSDLGPQIGPAPTKPSVLVVEILIGVVEFHWRFGVFYFILFFFCCGLVVLVLVVVAGVAVGVADGRVVVELWLVL